MGGKHFVAQNDLPRRGGGVEKLAHAINMRVNNTLRKRLDAIHARHATTDSEVIRRLLEAWCDNVEAVDAVRWPIVIRENAAELGLAAEDAAAYGATPEEMLRRVLAEMERKRRRG